mmetsp:Transcript_34694/g.73920  ORF Transcript_34694/g.73920 Transcript_34694/m.73920 type:complete len:349 (-) Transcript_34694:861-1907(-)
MKRLLFRHERHPALLRPQHLPVQAPPRRRPRIHDQRRQLEFLPAHVHRVLHRDDDQQQRQQQRDPDQIPEEPLQKVPLPPASRTSWLDQPAPLLQRVPPLPIVRTGTRGVVAHAALLLPRKGERAGHRAGRHARHGEVVHLREPPRHAPILEVVERDGALDGPESEEGAVGGEGGGGDGHGGALDPVRRTERRGLRSGRGRRLRGTAAGGSRRSRRPRPAPRDRGVPPGQVRRPPLSAGHRVDRPPLQVAVEAPAHQDLRGSSHHPRILRFRRRRRHDRRRAAGIVHLALHHAQLGPIPGVEDAGRAVLGAAQHPHLSGVEVDGAHRLGVPLAFRNFRKLELFVVGLV